MKQYFMLLLGSGMFFTILSVGCRPETLRPDELLRYIRDPRHGLVQVAESGPWDLQVQYKPPEVMALLAVVEEGESSTTFERALQNSAGFWDFELRIRPATSHPVDELLTHSPDSLEAIRNHLAFGLQTNIYLKVNGDSIPCTFYHLQPSGKMDNAYHALISFERPESLGSEQQDLLLVLNEPLFGVRPFEFQWRKNDLISLPKLDYIQ